MLAFGKRRFSLLSLFVRESIACGRWKFQLPFNFYHMEDMGCNLDQKSTLFSSKWEMSGLLHYLTSYPRGRLFRSSWFYNTLSLQLFWKIMVQTTSGVRIPFSRSSPVTCVYTHPGSLRTIGHAHSYVFYIGVFISHGGQSKCCQKRVHSSKSQRAFCCPVSLTILSYLF